MTTGPVNSAIVIGAGTFGASIAWLLARDGVAVTLVDQYEPADPRATSGGETRLYRCAHGAADDYTRMARRGRELWLELAEETGTDLLVEHGMAWFAHRADGWEADSERVMRAAGIPVERLSTTEAAKLYPSLATDDLEYVLFEPEAGAIRAAAAVRALVAAAQAHGAVLRRGRAVPDESGVRLGDERLDADLVVWACGVWLRELFADLVSLRITRQELYFFAGGPAWAGVPAWVDYDLAAYGTGDIDGLGVKAAPDIEGPPLTPEDELPEVSADGEAVARGYLRGRFPALADVPLVGGTTCRYELTADSHFLAGPHPALAGVWLVGGGSGHGFKHGPALAERMIAAIRGEATLPAAFRLGNRLPGRSLRTAGSNIIR